jgi:hypothetical protein
LSYRLTPEGFSLKVDRVSARFYPTLLKGDQQGLSNHLHYIINEDKMMKTFSLPKGSLVLLVAGIMMLIAISCMAKASVRIAVDQQTLKILNRASSFLEKQQYPMSTEI